MKKNERFQALQILLRVFQDKWPLSQAMQQDNELSPFAKELCFGLCRHYFRLEALANCLINKQPKSLEVWLILLLGLYQLQVLQKEDYAVVQETVTLAALCKKDWAKGFINAALRRFCRERLGLLTKLKNDEAWLFAHPPWLITRFQQDWPNEWLRILKANDSHPPMSLRVNRFLLSRQAYLAKLKEAGFAASPHQFSPVGIKLNKACEVMSLPGFAEGASSVQDEAAQLAAPLLCLQPGLAVLDVCCAPGGKLCHILETEPQLARCIGVDIDKKRLQRVKDNLRRLNLEASLLQGDGLNPKTWWDGQLFDRILLDAPCSATGVIRRHPDIKLLRREKEVTAVAALQANLLQQLWPLLRKGGLLVYATCSILKEENEQQIAKFVTRQGHCHVIDENKPWGQNTGYGWQILPEENGCDGFFYSVLRKEE